MATLYVDGSTTEVVYEHAGRSVEVNGIPIGGWIELTGGGTTREGSTIIYGAGPNPRGRTVGKLKPEDITCKMEVATWQLLKTTLQAMALSKGITDSYGYQQVPWNIVDQWTALDTSKPSLTITTTVLVVAEKPDSPNDGNQLVKELTLGPVGAPTETYG